MPCFITWITYISCVIESKKHHKYFPREKKMTEIKGNCEEQRKIYVEEHYCNFFNEALEKYIEGESQWIENWKSAGKSSLWACKKSYWSAKRCIKIIFVQNMYLNFSPFFLRKIFLITFLMTYFSNLKYQFSTCEVSLSKHDDWTQIKDKWSINRFEFLFN